jgi:ribosomal-protein-alanine N-acetyltransferase
MKKVVWSVRRALSTDVDAILAIEQSCVEAPHWSEGVWKEVLATSEGNDPVRSGFVAEDHGRIAGFAVVSCARGVAELESVAVGEGARLQGAGRALCREAMTWSKGRGAEAIELEVRASSVGALMLYASLGFVEQGRRPGYYRDPTDDAVLMSSSLGSQVFDGGELGVGQRCRGAKV